MHTLTLHSLAKLNLYLKVRNLRPDGYHNIDTLFERISLFDTITLTLRQDNKIRIMSKGLFVPGGNANLCYRSAKLLQDRFKVNKGVDIKILKRIPVGAGLGGGSSNAAVTLIGLNKLWDLNICTRKLSSFGREIGSDVPFFIYDCNFALGSSRGDKISPLEELSSFNLWHILVVPKILVSTPLIYKKWDEYISQKNKKAGLTKKAVNVKIITSALRKGILAFLDKILSNNLEVVTIGLYKEVGRVKEKLSNLGVKVVKMSGSGSSVFGIVSSRKEALFLAARIRRENRSWRVYVVNTGQGRDNQEVTYGNY